MNDFPAYSAEKFAVFSPVQPADLLIENEDCAPRNDMEEPCVRHEPKTVRNDPCPCGSGRKYKKCHLAKA